MNKKNNNMLKILLLAMSLGFAMSGCKKVPEEEQSAAQTDVMQIDKTKLEKLERYISISTGLPQNQIIYDEIKEEFSVPGTPFKEKLKVMQKYYDEANEYKAKYEKQN